MADNRRVRRMRRPQLLLSVALALLLGTAGWWVFQALSRGAPRRLSLATGPRGSAAEGLGRKYQALLERSGVHLELVHTAGAVENLARVDSRSSRVDAGFVFGGTTSAGSLAEIESLGVIGYEQLWLFQRSDLAAEQLRSLAGQRLSIGQEGSGGREIALRLIELTRLDIRGTTLLSLDLEDAAGALERGDVDSALILTSFESPVVRRLLLSPGIRLVSFARARALAALDPSLSVFSLPAGVADMERRVPESDVLLVGSAASLVVRRDLHAGLKYLLLEAATEIHSGPGIFKKAGQFPAPEAIDIPLGETARHYYKAGRPFLQRHLPFWLAATLEEILLLLVPILGVAYPILRFGPSLFDFVARRRILRIYGELKLLETDLERAGPSKAGPDVLSRLDQLEADAALVRVPLSYSQMLYTLRQHIRLVREKFGAGRRDSSSDAPGLDGPQ